MDYEAEFGDDTDGTELADVGGILPKRAAAIRRNRAIAMMKHRIELLQKRSFKGDPHARKALQKIVEATDRIYRASKRRR